MTTRYITESNIVYESSDGGETTITSNSGLIIKTPRAGAYNTNGFEPPTITQNVWLIPSIGCTPIVEENFTVGNNVITYTGSGTAVFKVDFSVTCVGFGNLFYEFGISKNGLDPIEDLKTGISLNTSSSRNVNFSSFITMTTGDFISFAILNEFGTEGFSLYKFFISVS